jgi:CRISPR-associated protein (TIGR02584 family)
MKNKLTPDSAWRDVLLAGMGISPGILTETVWALAHREEESIVPDSIYIVTTASGRERLVQSLFEQGGWARLKSQLETEGFDVAERLRFGPASEFFSILSKPDGSGDLDDIVTAEESEAVANTVMRTVRGVTTDPGSRVIASIAGGRKTLSVLLTSCMSLLGRSQDILCHVLVNPPYDSPRLEPPFLFPEKGVRHTLGEGGKSVLSARARIDLTEIPIVKVRGLYEKEYKQLPGDYMTLVRRIQGEAPKPTNYPEVIVDTNSGHLVIAGTVIRLNAMEFALMLTLGRLVVEGTQLPNSWYDCQEGMMEIRALSTVPFNVNWHEQFLQKDIVPDDFRKIASSIRRKVRSATRSSVVADALIPSLRTASREGYPRKRLVIKEFSQSSDVR